MKALLLKKSKPISEKPLQLVEIPEPVIGNDEILVRVSVCGACHTDLHIIEGELLLPKLPIVPGHQIVGRVEEVGAGVSGFKKGDRVGVPWLNSTCGKCKFCTSNRENLCGDAKFTGYSVDGGFAEFVKVKGCFAYHLPEGIPDENVAPLLCAGVIGYRSYKLCGLRRGEILALYGFGASAHIVIQVARFQGQRIFVFSRSSQHRELAIKLGAEWAGSIDQSPPEKTDAGIIFAPAGNIVPVAMKNLDRGGRLVCAGIHMSPIPGMEYGLLYYERVLMSAANSTREDVREFLKLAVEAKVQTVVRVQPLVEANQLLRDLKNGLINGAGVLKL